MTPEEEVISDLVRHYGLRKCPVFGCIEPPCVPHPGVLDQTHRKGKDAVVWSCGCGWKKTLPLKAKE